MASSHDFPHFSEPPEAQLRQVLADQQAKFRSDLDFQVRAPPVYFRGVHVVLSVFQVVLSRCVRASFPWF